MHKEARQRHKADVSQHGATREPKNGVVESGCNHGTRGSIGTDRSECGEADADAVNANASDVDRRIARPDQIAHQTQLSVHALPRDDLEIQLTLVRRAPKTPSLSGSCDRGGSCRRSGGCGCCGRGCGWGSRGCGENARVKRTVVQKRVVRIIEHTDGRVTLGRIHVHKRSERWDDSRSASAQAGE